VITRLLPLAFIAMMTQAGAQEIPPPVVPDAIKAPAGEVVVMHVTASGSQIYECHAGEEGKPAWAFKAPEADLRDPKGAIVGRHFAGPTWKDKDGSEVIGKLAAKVHSPDPNSIPWLLVSATGHSGEGVFSQVSSIQRINTHGGMPPPAADCSTATKNTERKTPYTADYYFYAAAK
jgi:hypothetical protein